MADSRIISKESKQSPTVSFSFKLSKIKWLVMCCVLLLGACINFAYSAVRYSGLSGSELEQKLAKLLRLTTKEERSHSNSTKSGTQREFSVHSLGPAHPSLILELAMFSLENSLPDLAANCLRQVPRELVQSDPRLHVLHDLISTQVLLARQGSGPNKTYTKPAVEERIGAISHLEQTLMSAQRISDPDMVQVSVCVYE